MGNPTTIEPVMAEPDKKLRCILLVDDNPADNYYNRFILNEAHICDHIQTAVNGFEALSYLKRSGINKESESYLKPEIILLDINMPRMNGFEFLAAYSKLDEDLKSGIRILMLTTTDTPEEHQQALAFKEVVAFLSKPLSIDGIQKIIRKFF